MIEKTNLLDCMNEYAIGVKSRARRKKIVNRFHDEVIKQILLGNVVLLPGDIKIEIIKHKYFVHYLGNVKRLTRLGFDYKVRITYDKLKRKKIKFTTAKSLEKKLKTVLENTDFDYKLVENSFR